MDNFNNNKFQVTKGSASLRLREIMMDSDGLLTIVKLNIFFLLTTVPVLPFVILFTGGGSITALLYCTNQLVKTGSVPDVRKTYFTVFKNYYKRTFLAGFVVTILNCIFISGLMIYLIMASENMIYLPFASLSLIILIIIRSVALHLFPSFTEMEDKSLKELIKDAVYTALSKMKETIIAVVVSMVIIAGVILMLPKTLPLLLVMIFSVPALACGFAHSDCEFISDII